MTVNENLAELERNLEDDVREAQQLLALSREEAMKEMDSRRDSLGAATLQAVRDLEGLADEADSSLSDLQARLGHLNLLLAEEEIRDLDTLQKYRERVLNAMESANDALGKLATEGRAGWTERRQVMEEVWRRFFRSLELVRLHVMRDADRALEGFDQERRQLIEELGRLQEKPLEHQDLKAEIGKQYRTFLPYLQAFFVWPEVVAPKPPGDKRELG